MNKDCEYIFGIDNGYGGGISCINLSDHNDAHTFDMPLIEWATGFRYNEKEILNILSQGSYPSTVLMEKCQVFKIPGNKSQGSVSMFTYGEGYGILKGLITASGNNRHIVPPKEWQKYFGISSKVGDTKQLAYEKAKQLFPNLKFTGTRGGLKTGRCDSIMIAEYGYQLYTNNNKFIHSIH